MRCLCRAWFFYANVVDTFSCEGEETKWGAYAEHDFLSILDNTNAWEYRPTYCTIQIMWKILLTFVEDIDILYFWYFRQVAILAHYQCCTSRLSKVWTLNKTSLDCIITWGYCNGNTVCASIRGKYMSDLQEQKVASFFASPSQKCVYHIELHYNLAPHRHLILLPHPHKKMCLPHWPMSSCICISQKMF